MFTTALCPRCTAIITIRTEYGIDTYRCRGCGAGAPSRMGNVIDLRERRARRQPHDLTYGRRPAA
ncbi:hypothetical protein GCM10010472_54730 [Pseudonocardia halophobica]|uniref:Uncharacterized protein n=1 Tax=Pseudonocardia halophobica TaxID=29401 RepID=A0A9W6L0U9_9PSEU|nr:hypothetical protein [Pseudonocardia halophobica]GLL11551.1 hypothetical protein GCM10017577_26920 [Pseudonocardia halophobica]